MIISRDAANAWWVVFQCDLGEAPPKVPVQTTVGIDMGLTTLATLSTGEKIENPHCFKKAEATLRRRQKDLARKQRGSKNREKARILVAKAHAHVHNQRLNHAREVAKDLTDRFDLISFEDLNIKGLAAGMLAKSVNDASWGLLRHAVACKAECAGKTIGLVDPRNTSQRCCWCGEIVPKTLADREHRCPHCGLVLDRDHNAAININALGRSALEPKFSASKEEPHDCEARPVVYLGSPVIFDTPRKRMLRDQWADEMPG